MIEHAESLGLEEARIAPGRYLVEGFDVERRENRWWYVRPPGGDWYGRFASLRRVRDHIRRELQRESE